MWRIGEGAGSHDYQKLVEARMRLTIDTTLK
jgi:hypothetical protein